MQSFTIPIRKLALTLLVILGCSARCRTPALAITEQERARVAELSETLRAAGQLYAEGKFLDSASKVSQVQQAVIELLVSKDPALQQLAKPLYGSLTKAHGLLELQGAQLAALPAWDEIARAESMENAAETSGVSFTSQIAPLLINACGNCHINNRRGQFSMATYSDLMQGAAGAVVLFPGSSRGSRLVDVIESGDMPRGGGKVSSQQLASLKLWIDQGAQFDGPDAAAPITSFAPGNNATPPAGQTMPIEVASGDETVSFSKDIAPILMENCNGCHIAGRRASGNFRMDSFTQFARGGDSGAVIEKIVDESLLIKKLKGESGQRMPAGGRPPLTMEQIQLISTWIREGATFDGPSPDANIESVVNLAWARAATHEALFERRQQRSLERWTRVLPNDQPSTAKNEEILVLGNVPPDRIETVLQNLKQATEQAKELLKAPAKEPLLKGGQTIFVLKSRYDYSEFGRMTESRELPKDWLAHWHADPVDAYGVLSAEAGIDQKQAEALALQVVAGAYVGSFTGVPFWFAEGVARNLVKTSFRRSDERVVDWQRNMPAAMQKIQNAKMLIEGRADEETLGLIGMGLTGILMDRSNRNRFDKLLEMLRAGQAFDVACTATFAPPEALVKSWLGR